MDDHSRGTREEPLGYDEGRGSTYVEDIPGRRSFAGFGPKGYRRSDQRVFQCVCDALEDHPAVDASDIEVGCDRGEVTLAGIVPESGMLRLAELCARMVCGVLGVRNLLRVSGVEALGGPQSRAEEQPAESVGCASPDRVDLASEQSLPASDPPSYCMSRIGAPQRRE